MDSKLTIRRHYEPCPESQLQALLALLRATKLREANAEKAERRSSITGVAGDDD